MKSSLVKRGCLKSNDRFHVPHGLLVSLCLFGTPTHRLPPPKKKTHICFHTLDIIQMIHLIYFCSTT